MEVNKSDLSLSLSLSFQLLLLSVSDKESPSVVQQLTDLIKQQLSTAKKDQEQISLCDVLGLAVFMFSLLEDGCLQEQNEEREMKVSSDLIVALWLDWCVCAGSSL